jgi:hypothetical protein
MKVLGVRATCGHCGKEWDTKENTTAPFQHAQETGHTVAVQTNLFHMYNQKEIPTAKYFHDKIRMEKKMKEKGSEVEG